MITLIDNYDSFTFNLVQYLGDLGQSCNVIRNDEKTVEEIINSKPSAIVLSPGPCNPDQAGICLDLVLAASNENIPMLGVCLGFQSMVQTFGGKIVRGPSPMHGKVSSIKHEGKGVFKDLPSHYNVTRYHSLVAERESFPDTLEITSETLDGIIMGLQHKTKPIHGVLFHPESIATEHGHALLKNFLGVIA